MSQEARDALIASGKVFFQIDACRTDLLDQTLTDSNLIELSQNLVDAGHIIEYTVVRTGHHNDGQNGHFGGRAFDCWPLASPKEGDWLDAADQRFVRFLHDLGAFSGMRQLGLAGTADTAENRIATGLPYEDWNAKATCFSDEGADHIHAGVWPA